MVQIDLINDHDLTKKPPLKTDTPDHVIRQFYGQHFLDGWLKVKQSVSFKTVINK